MAIKLNEYENNRQLLEVDVSGTLHRDDYPKFVPEFDRQVRNHGGKVRVLFDMRDFEGWDMGGLWEDAKFGVTHFSDIERLAMVGAKKWQQWMATICKPFTKAKIRYFETDQKAEALAWLESDDGGGRLEKDTQAQIRAMKGVRS